MHLLNAGIDITTIAHWLGHASIDTTNRYIAINLEAKREALARIEPPPTAAEAPVSWRRDTSILEWLEQL